MIIVSGILIAIIVLIGLYIALNWAPELTVEELRQRWGTSPSIFVKVAGMQVHLRDEGPRNDPRPIALLHGTLSSLHTWDGWADALKSERRVIRFDLAGHGLTGPSPDGYSIDADVRMVVAVLDALSIGRCVLGGNSLGGHIAWRTALEHPSRVEKLILVDSDGYPTRPISRPIAFYLSGVPTINWMVRNTFPRGLTEQGLRHVYGVPKKVTPELIVRYRMLTRRTGNRQATIERLRHWRRPGTDLSFRVAELKLPTLIVWGGRDRLLPPSSAERFNKDIADSKLVIFDDLGHLPHEEDPARTVRAVKQFLGVA